MASIEWPRFAAAAISRISQDELERYRVECCVEDVILLADRVDAEWEKRRPLLGFTELPAVKEISAALDADMIRREERERVLDAVWNWLLNNPSNMTFRMSRESGRFDPPKEKS